MRQRETAEHRWWPGRGYPQHSTLFQISLEDAYLDPRATGKPDPNAPADGSAAGRARTWVMRRARRTESRNAVAPRRVFLKFRGI